jgi:hypothetical protein
MSFVVGAMAYTLTWGDQMASRGSRKPQDPGQLLESLILFAAAGLAAPVAEAEAVRTDVRGGRA